MSLWIKLKFSVTMGLFNVQCLYWVMCLVKDIRDITMCLRSKYLDMHDIEWLCSLMTQNIWYSNLSKISDILIFFVVHPNIFSFSTQRFQLHSPLLPRLVFRLMTSFYKTDPGVRFIPVPPSPNQLFFTFPIFPQNFPFFSIFV